MHWSGPGRWPKLIRSVELVPAVLVLCASACLAMEAPGLTAAARIPRAGAPFQARIGNSVVVLTGPWRFHPGDDAAWSAPEFDDSSWDTLDLTPPEGSYDPITGSSGFVPGWTVHGYPKLIGYAWYRLRVEVEDDASDSGQRGLALSMPLNFDDAYQVFANGQLIGQFGGFAGRQVSYYNSQPRSFPLPPRIHSGPVTVAVRIWMDADTPLTNADVGGLHGPPMLGQASSIDAMLRLEWDSVNRTQIGNLLSFSFLLVTAFLGFVLFWLDPHELAYLWLALACAASGLARATVVMGYYSLALSMVSETLLQDVILNPVTLGLWALFWAYWFGLDDLKRISRMAGALTAVSCLNLAMLRPPLFGSLVPVGSASLLEPLSLVFKLLLGALLLWITYRGIRTRRADGLLALIPILFMVFWAYAQELTVIHIPTIVRFLGITVTFGQIATLMMLTSVSILLMRRFIRGQRERELWRLEIEQARQVQQVLIPEAPPTVPGFKLASEYLPAQQVGGDFFQILPAKSGGVLVVIGDVSGKGMPAAMTVSLLVGTVRTLVHFTESPGEILAAMNLRMLARSHGGFTTCLVLRIAPDGQVTAANAGHLSPYLRGKEAIVESGLPLGLNAATKYPETAFRLGENEQLTLVSDGVVEARGKSGELFGFDRTAAAAAGSAEAIARAAQEFGQSDDITVLTVTRVPAGEKPATTVTTAVFSLVR